MESSEVVPSVSWRRLLQKEGLYRPARMMRVVVDVEEVAAVIIMMQHKNFGMNAIIHKLNGKTICPSIVHAPVDPGLCSNQGDL